MIVTIDIETMPGQAEWVVEHTNSTVKHPGNITKQESIDKWYETKGEKAMEDAWRKTSLNATLGEIAVIGWAYDDEDPFVEYREPADSEKELLESFFEELAHKTSGDRGHQTSMKFLGHNVLFDLGFIWRRAVIHRVKPCVGFPVVHELKPWSTEIIDTCQIWKGSDKSTSGSLDVLCKAFGIEGKGEITGASVWDEIKAGNILDVVEYCKDDVIRARALYRRMLFL